MASTKRAPIFPSDLDDYRYGHDDADEDEFREKNAEALMSVRDDFRHVFTSTPQGDRALTYLYHFCRQGMTTLGSSERETSFNEGMRRVYLQIAGFVQMTDEKIYDMAQSKARERE